MFAQFFTKLHGAKNVRACMSACSQTPCIDYFHPFKSCSTQCSACKHIITLLSSLLVFPPSSWSKFRGPISESTTRFKSVPNSCAFLAATRTQTRARTSNMKDIGLVCSGSLVVVVVAGKATVMDPLIVMRAPGAGIRMLVDLFKVLKPANWR